MPTIDCANEAEFLALCKAYAISANAHTEGPNYHIEYDNTWLYGEVPVLVQDDDKTNRLTLIDDTQDVRLTIGELLAIAKSYVATEDQFLREVLLKHIDEVAPDHEFLNLAEALSECPCTAHIHEIASR